MERHSRFIMITASLDTSLEYLYSFQNGAHLILLSHPPSIVVSRSSVHISIAVATFHLIVPVALHVCSYYRLSSYHFAPPKKLHPYAFFFIIFIIRLSICSSILLQGKTLFSSLCSFHRLLNSPLFNPFTVPSTTLSKHVFHSFFILCLYTS